MEKLDLIVKLLEEQALEQQKAVQEQQKINHYICAKLDAIEANTLVIKGAVVSDFTGIERDTKAELEVVANAIVLADKEIEEHYALMDTTNKSKEAKIYRKFVNSFTTGKELESYVFNASKGDRYAVGQWVSSIIVKIFGHNFHGKYPEQLHELVSLLVGYYAVERISKRMY
jgi:hypothetical protein